MTNKRSKGIRLREMQNRKEIMMGEFAEKGQYCNGDLPVTVIWRQRANRQEANRRG